MGPIRTYLRALIRALLIGVTLPAVASAIKLKMETITAWDAYVAATEARIERELASDCGILALDFSTQAGEYRAQLLSGDMLIFEIKTADDAGMGIPIPEGAIHHWHGSIFLPGVRLETYLYHAQHPSAVEPKRVNEDHGARPRGLRVFVDPLVDRSAHEMIENTLVRIRRRYSADGLARAR